MFWRDATKASVGHDESDDWLEHPHTVGFLRAASDDVNRVRRMFLGRDSNDDVFDEQSGELPLIDLMLSRLEYLRRLYSMERETAKAWRRERLEAYDDLMHLQERCGGERCTDTAEYRRWQEIEAVEATDYQPPTRGNDGDP